MEVLIFGCGYLGRAVAAIALARGRSVAALTRNPDTARELAASGIRPIVADLADDSWHAEIDSADFALDCVGAGAASVSAYQRTYLDGMRSILAWSQRAHVGTFVYTSSTSVYPGSSPDCRAGVLHQPPPLEIDETFPTGPRDGNAAVLVETEEELRRGGDQLGRWFILRLAGIYGPGRTHLVEQVRSGHVSGAPDRRLNLIHRDDAASAIWAAFDAPAAVTSQILNVSDGAPSPKREVADWLATRLGVPSPKFTGTPAAGRSSLVPDRIIDSTRIRADLGWTPSYPSYREGYAAILGEAASGKR